MFKIDSRLRFSVLAKELLSCVPSWDCHIHTLFTDGSATVEECAGSAYEKGMSRIIFTEHAEAWHAKKDRWFVEYVKGVRSVAQRYEGKMEVFLGIEAPAIDFETALDLTDEMKHEVDYILGTAHRYPGLGNRRVRDLLPEECVSMEFKTLLALAGNPDIDAIAHVGGTCRQYCCEFPEDLTVEVVKTATKNGVAIELNPKYHDPLSRLIDICIQEDARVTIGSDAHSLIDMLLLHWLEERSQNRHTNTALRLRFSYRSRRVLVEIL